MWVSPYNPVLSLRYNTHINVQLCNSNEIVKYMFKYMHKGPDRALISMAAYNRANPGGFYD